MNKAGLSKSLIMLALGSQLSLTAPAAFGQQTSPDVAATENVNLQDGSPNSRLMLFGKAKKSGEQDSTESGAEQKLQATDIGPDADPAAGPLQAEQAQSDSEFKLALEKLARKEKLSAEEYRSLGVGVTGFETDQKFFQPTAKVTSVYKDSPAYNAGIRKGDEVEYGPNPEQEKRWKANPTQPLFEVEFERVGTRRDLTLVRHGEKIAITLYAMNMEDITEPKIRHMWEQIVASLGFPQGGEFMGTNLHNLAKVSQ